MWIFKKHQIRKVYRSIGTGRATFSGAGGGGEVQCRYRSSFSSLAVSETSVTVGIENAGNLSK